ncbi:MAG: hypothetical protein GY753_12750 [Gammaproteobacteria bacterium]|nr:hypothetical protein [Gammaproteobacteria bacterium]
MTPVPVGKDNDGLAPMTSGGPLDRDYGALVEEYGDAREAWRKNPIARRLIGLVTAYVVGGAGIGVTSKNKKMAKYTDDFFDHAENTVKLRQPEWSDELGRAGELFLVLHMNEASGVPYVRSIPASKIIKIDWREGDYESETYYYERRGPGEEPKVWRGWRVTERDKEPMMLHYAINRPVGNMRGESDLSPILPWMQRYSRWLDDRVRLNAAMRVYMWIVKAPKARLEVLQETYRRPPESGSVLFVDKDAESWEAVTPSLGANDAEKDGRAIRWMIISGGLGTALTDIGESETASRSTAESMAEQRRRFLRQRQAYFSWMLSDLVMQGWNWGVRTGVRKGRRMTQNHLIMEVPDLAPADNEALASASKEIADAMAGLRDIVGDSDTLKELTARMVLKFAGEPFDNERTGELASGDIEAAGNRGGGGTEGDNGTPAIGSNGNMERLWME